MREWILFFDEFFCWFFNFKLIFLNGICNYVIDMKICNELFIFVIGLFRKIKMEVVFGGLDSII